jgi:YggT family protein
MTIEPDRPAEIHEEERVAVRETSTDAPVARIQRAEVEREELVEQGAGMQRRESVVRDARGDEHREVHMNDVAGSQWLWLSKLSSVVWLIIGIIEVFIGLRFILRAIAANPENPFANFVYSVAAPFLAPFFGLTGTPSAGGAVLELPALIAMVVYFLIGWLIVSVIWLAERPLTHGMTRYDRYRM